MFLTSPYWSDLTTQELKQLTSSAEAAEVVAVLPLAATEQHGPHLPLSVDSLILDAIIQTALPHIGWGDMAISKETRVDVVPALFLPTQKISLSTEHRDFEGTLTLSPQTTLALWMEIGASVARTGIKKLVLFNSHGGNTGLMSVAARELRATHGIIVFYTSWYELPQAQELKQLFTAHEHRFGIHAGAIETSMILAQFPNLVAMSQAKKFCSHAEDRAKSYTILGDGKSAKLGWLIQDYNHEGATGDPSKASADKGSALLDSAGQALAHLLMEVSQLPLSILTR